MWASGFFVGVATGLVLGIAYWSRCAHRPTGQAHIEFIIGPVSEQE